MKQIIMLTGAALFLAACGGKPAKLQGLCTSILEGDPQAISELARDDITAQPFCECYTKTAEAGGDAVLKLHTDVWSALSDMGQKTGAKDIETMAEALEATLRSDASAYGFDEAAFDAVGEYLENISDQLKDGGTCAI